MAVEWKALLNYLLIIYVFVFFFQMWSSKCQQ